MKSWELSLADLGRALADGALDAPGVLDACLARLAQHEPTLHACLAVDEAGARLAAEASRARRAAGKVLGPLDGVPVVVKDNLCTEGVVTTAGSKMLAGFRPPSDATVVARLKAQGAVVLAKTNLDEFGMGSSTEASAFGPTLNPFDPSRVPGGSSGGSAAALAARYAFGALGTDTGGSVRQPAAFTGTVGLKPTYGRVSRSGVVAYASSLDQVGPMARTVEDVALLYEAIAGADPRDATCSTRPVSPPRPHLDEGVAGLTVGVVELSGLPGVSEEVARAVAETAQRLQGAGAKLVSVTLPDAALALAAYYVIATSEASSNLGRYDGVRYGHRAAGAATLPALYERSRAEGFGAEVQRRIMLGTFSLSSGYYDAYYGKAQRARGLVRAAFHERLVAADVLLTAVSPVLPWKLGERSADPMAMYAMDLLTVPVSLAGLPAISVPVGQTPAGLPLGIQLVGRAFDEVTLLRCARAVERAAPPIRWPA